MRRPAQPMTPVEITRRARNLETGRTETWQARSRDGVWRYDREDEDETPWVITHLPTGRTWEETSLRHARHATATRLAAEVEALADAAGLSAPGGTR